MESVYGECSYRSDHYGSMGDTPMCPHHELSWTRSTPLNSSITNIIWSFSGEITSTRMSSCEPMSRKPGSPSLWPTCQAIMPENGLMNELPWPPLTIKSIAPQIKTIAELLDSENKPHLRRANVDEIIVRGEHVGSLLASAVNSPGLPRILSIFCLLVTATKFRRVDIPHDYAGRTFREYSYFTGKSITRSWLVF